MAVALVTDILNKTIKQTTVLAVDLTRSYTFEEVHVSGGVCRDDMYVVSVGAAPEHTSLNEA